MKQLARHFFPFFLGILLSLNLCAVESQLLDQLIQKDAEWLLDRATKDLVAIQKILKDANEALDRGDFSMATRILDPGNLGYDKNYQDISGEISLILNVLKRKNLSQDQKSKMRQIENDLDYVAGAISTAKAELALKREVAVRREKDAIANSSPEEAKKAQDLTNTRYASDSPAQGQFLSPAIGAEPLCFQGCGPGGCWKCMLLNDSSVIEVSPSEIAEILPLYKDSNPFDVISYTLCQVTPHTGESPEMRRIREARLKVCKNLLDSFSAPRTTTLQRCLVDLDQELKEIDYNIRSARTNFNNAGNTIIDRYVQGTPFVSIRSALAASDFQIAIPCYFFLRTRVLEGKASKLPGKYKHDLESLFNKMGNEIRDAYNLQADGCSVRVAKFLSVCPDEVGHWKKGTPKTLDALREMAEQSLNSFEKTMEYSPTLDFRHWGNAMLGVFRMFPNTALVTPQATAFDKALQNYSAKHK